MVPFAASRGGWQMQVRYISFFFLLALSVYFFSASI